MPISLKDVRAAMEMFTNDDVAGYRQMVQAETWPADRGVMAVEIARTLHAEGVENAGMVAAAVVEAVYLRGSGWTPADIDAALAA